jgi:hypothetical protein
MVLGAGSKAAIFQRGKFRVEVGRAEEFDAAAAALVWGGFAQPECGDVFLVRPNVAVGENLARSNGMEGREVIGGLKVDVVKWEVAKSFPDSATAVLGWMGRSGQPTNFLRRLRPSSIDCMLVA